MEGPVSKLDRLRQELSTAEAKLARAKPGTISHDGLSDDVERLTRLLANEEKLALKILRGLSSP